MSFDPKATVVRVSPEPETKPIEQPAPKGERSLRERAADARSRAFAHCIASPKEEFAEFAESDFLDGVGDEPSSRWDWNYWCLRAAELKVPPIRAWIGSDGSGDKFLMTWWNLWSHPRRYEASTGLWTHSNGETVPLSEVREAVEKWIAERKALTGGN
jgi:hypothetical protein